MTREQFAEEYVVGFSKTVRFLMKMYGGRSMSRDDAEDIAQTAWIRAFEKIGDLRSEKSFIGWVNTIALNEFRNTRRRNIFPECLGDNDCVFHPVYHFDLYGVIEKNLTSLDQEIVVCHYILGMTCEEISSRVAVSPIGIRVRLCRSRKVLGGVITGN